MVEQPWNPFDPPRRSRAGPFLLGAAASAAVIMAGIGGLICTGHLVPRGIPGLSPGPEKRDRGSAERNEPPGADPQIRLSYDESHRHPRGRYSYRYEDEHGWELRYTWDALDRPVEQVHVDPGDPSRRLVRRFAYDASGRRVAERDPWGLQKRFIYSGENVAAVETEAGFTEEADHLAALQARSTAATDGK